MFSPWSFMVCSKFSRHSNDMFHVTLPDISKRNNRANLKGASVWSQTANLCPPKGKQAIFRQIIYKQPAERT